MTDKTYPQVSSLSGGRWLIAEWGWILGRPFFLAVAKLPFQQFDEALGWLALRVEEVEPVKMIADRAAVIGISIARHGYGPCSGRQTTG